MALISPSFLSTLQFPLSHWGALKRTLPAIYRSRPLRSFDQKLRFLSLPSSGLSKDWYTEWYRSMGYSYKVDDVLFHATTSYQDVSIFLLRGYGRALVLDNEIQSSEKDEFIYHESLVQPSMLWNLSPKKVFIGGGGEGATAREVLRHNSVDSVTMVDIDEELVKICKEWLPSMHKGSWNDQRLHVHFGDAAEYLMRTKEKYDVIILDLCDPVEGSPCADMYTEEFYSMMKSKLEDGGVFVTQASSGNFHEVQDVFSPVLHTLSQVFPYTSGYTTHVPSYASMYAFCIGALSPNPFEGRESEIDEAISQRVTGELRFYDGITHRSIFSLSKAIRGVLEKERRVLTSRDVATAFSSA